MCRGGCLSVRADCATARWRYSGSFARVSRCSLPRRDLRATLVTMGDDSAADRQVVTEPSVYCSGEERSRHWSCGKNRTIGFASCPLPRSFGYLLVYYVVEGAS